ncbi:hypothetical protein [Jongsikchunia kroppenstedtii]|uniref:hypothetical protein n=1 Tax=Jongsikchunia kroppenstedtii TaxID=1121721 RepID=UPI0003720939|nr:hypothetical protein [Jongsikchunia kroppenstedtii]
MRAALRALVFGSSLIVIIAGGIPTAKLMNDRHFRKKAATDACLADTRSMIPVHLAGELDAQQIAVAVAGTRFSHVGGRTTGLAEDDGDRAVRGRHRTRADILTVWEFSGYADIPGVLPFGDSNHNIFSCNAVVFTDHSVATYGIQITEWHPGDLVG